MFPVNEVSFLPSKYTKINKKLAVFLPLTVMNEVSVSITLLPDG